MLFPVLGGAALELFPTAHSPVAVGVAEAVASMLPDEAAGFSIPEVVGDVRITARVGVGDSSIW